MADPDRAAAEAIARKLRDVADPDITALEIVALIRGLGWRPTEARPVPSWRHPHSAGRPPTGDYLAARAELDARTAPHQEAS